MSSNIPKTSSVPPSEPALPTATDTGVQVNDRATSDILSTATHHKSNLTKAPDTKHSATIEQQLKGIRFSEEDARNITSFAKAFGKGLDEIEINIPTFRTKIKSLIAKLLQLLGKGTRTNKLFQDEREQVLETFQKMVQQEPKHLQKILLENRKNDSVLAGYGKLFFPGKDSTSIVRFLKNLIPHICKEQDVLDGKSIDTFGNHLAIWRPDNVVFFTGIKEDEGVYDDVGRHLMKAFGKYHPNFEDELMQNKGSCVPILFSSPKARKIFKEKVLSVTTEQFQKSLETNLAQGNSKSNFDQNCPICKDLDRGYAIIFKIGDKEISINPSHKKGGVNSFGTLQEQLKTLCEDEEDAKDAEQIQNFCKIFSSQGVFANVHPNGPWVIYAQGNGFPTFTVTFLENSHVTVNVKTEGEETNPYPFGGVPMLIPTKTECEFSFDYNIENGIGSNVQIHKFKQTFFEEQ